MKVCFLGNAESPLISFLQSKGERIFQTEKKIDIADVDLLSADFIVSYGYRFKIGTPIVNQFRKRIINLHIAFLPWNKGADPNFWSFLENTIKGVTIHYVDEGIDTGEILFQKKIDFDISETLKSSYDKLQKEMQELFYLHWDEIKNGQVAPIKQPGPGSFHKIKDKEKFLYLLSSGYDTPVKKIMDEGKRLNLSVKSAE